jgi:hypothetical protein
MYPVIVCIAKLELDYIEEFVKYHLYLGFKHIYIYDNEDTPTYAAFLNKYSHDITVIHFPFNNYSEGVQYVALKNFKEKFLFNSEITHVAHIDVDEFIVLKKHHNICDFIREYIIDDCQAIGMNWRFFGSSNQTEKTNEPVTIRFTKCSEQGDQHIKTLFKKDNFLKYRTVHDIVLSEGYVKSTNGTLINGPFNHNIDFSVIQLNHYRCKTLPEFKYIRTRGRADLNYAVQEDIELNFKIYDKNEIEELTAHNFYKKISD